MGDSVGAGYPGDNGDVGLSVGFPGLFRKSAGYAGKILRGANPKDLPVEQPTRFKLVLNLTTAKAIGVTIPIPPLVEADEVIE